jgi:cell division protein FtsL
VTVIIAASTLGIVLIVVGALILLLFIGGLIATARRSRAEAARFRELIDKANAALAEAHAQDKGWDRATLEAAARRVFEERHAGVPIEEMHLVQVVDRPGTESDLAVFHIHGAGRVETITLGRRDDAWVPADQV